jgi:hypothetical protein
MKRRRRPIAQSAALALSAALVLAAPALSLPRALSSYYLGPKLIRAEIFLKAGGIQHDYRIDVGRIRSVSVVNQTITLKERDGTTQPIPIGVAARIRVNGHAANVRALRAGMYATTVRDGDQPAEQVFASRVAPKRPLPRSLEVYYLGAKMIRAEIVLKSGSTLHDYRIDVGRIRSTSTATQTIMLRERDGSMQSIQVAPTARIIVNGSSSSFAALHQGMHATTIRDGDAPADQVFATQ